MDPIDSISRAMQLLRRRLAANPARDPAAALRETGAAAGSAGPATARVRATIANRLRGLDAKDQRFDERATEAFLEGVLLAEFGAELINEAQFRQLILGVAREMRADPETAQQLDKLIQTLREE